MEARKLQESKNINLEFCIQRKHALKTKVKALHFKINESYDNSIADLRIYCRLKGNDTR
jgi:hypothetical protein